MKKIITVSTTLIFTFICFAAQGAPLTITITQGVESAAPIAVVPFFVKGQKKPSDDIAAIVSNDLARTGQFKPLAARDMLSKPYQPEKVKYQNWRILGIESLVIGQVSHLGADKYEVSFWLLDVFKAKQLAAFKIPGNSATLRTIAHKISDIVYEQLTGVKGAFSSRLAYITADGVGRDRKYVLWVADSDGYNAQEILRSPEPIMSPRWSPDGKRIAYASLEGDGRQKVVIQNWTSKQRQTVKTPLSGLHGAPAWSPDGQKLAFTITKNGNAEIYTLHLKSEKMRKLTRHSAIDTEPVWMADGKSVIFTSDRGGRPQLYKVSANGGRVQRLTFEGQENARASVSPDGKLIAMVHKTGGKYQIATMELATGTLQVLTDGRLDESPSFAPNGSMIIYATTSGRQGALASVSVDGAIKLNLTSEDTREDVREPAWSPLIN